MKIDAEGLIRLEAYLEKALGEVSFLINKVEMEQQDSDSFNYKMEDLDKLF